MIDDSPEYAEWRTLSAAFLTTHPDAQPGKMMSSPALALNGKVFAFFTTKGGRTGLGVRLGRETDFEGLGLQDWQHLAPFRTKPPMKDWIVAGVGDQARWPVLMQQAYDAMRHR